MHVPLDIRQYYHWEAGRPLRDEDGCPYEHWAEVGVNKRYMIHPAGFPVFLSPDEARAYDGFAGGDPRRVFRNKSSPKHTRRFALTLEMIRKASRRLSPPLRILDVGCGGGHISGAIGEAFPSARISAMDCSISAIECAKELYPSVDFAVADAYRLPYAASYFDCVVSNNMWEHVPDPMRVLQGIAKVLREGGALVLSTPNRYRLLNLLRIIRGRAVATMSPDHVTEYSIGQVVEQLRFGGFTVDDVNAEQRGNPRRGLKSFVAWRIIAPVIGGYLRIVRSHHGLGDPSFFLATRILDDGFCAPIRA